jgi:hypothetical protein
MTKYKFICICLFCYILFLNLSLFSQSYTKLDNGIKFKVSDVEIAGKLLYELPYKKALQHRTNLLLEGFPNNEKENTLVPVDAHGFISALHYSFAQHRPLVISPDMIWLMICQGVAMHIENDTEGLRDKFVKFEGKKKISVRRDDFKKGNEDNPWEDVFPQFTDSLKRYLQDGVYDFFIPEFSTTGIKQKNAFEIALLSSVKNYFDYNFVTFCGIPEITLEGTTDDWSWILEQCKQMDKFDLGDWGKELVPLIKEFVNASEGKINLQFWKSIYKWLDESGGPYITGWIVKFFPFVYENGKLIKNDLIYGEEFAYKGLKPNFIPSGLSKADIEWIYFEDVFSEPEIYNMEFYSGFMGISQDKQTKALKSEISWAVRDVSDNLHTQNSKNESLIDRIRIPHNEIDVSLFMKENFYVHDLKWYIKNADSIYIEKEPNIFPGKCVRYPESIYELERYISKELNKKIKWKGKIKFYITWAGTIDRVEILESNKPEYNELIIEVLEDINGCRPGKYGKWFVNYLITIDINIK